jgi:hypothetical protein
MMRFQGFDISIQHAFEAENIMLSHLNARDDIFEMLALFNFDLVRF